MKELNENEIKAVAGAAGSAGSVMASGGYNPNGPSFPYESPPWIWLK